MDYIAHRISDGGKEQSVLKHLSNTAVAASEFADIFNAGEEAYFCGMLHDIGKYSAAFQRRIRGSPERVDHSTAGTLVAAREYRDIPAAFCIAGHHGGLPDAGNKKGAIPSDSTFWGKMKRTVGRDIEDYGAFRNEIEIPESKLPPSLISDNISAFFFIRMLYSCLVDADFLDTEAFMSDGCVDRSIGEPLAVLADKLNKHTEQWQNPKSELNRKRLEILNSVTGKSGGQKGLFTLTVPTGGGKTITSMSFALNHAVKHDLRRVIYVIPYTSIIEQTQAVFEEVFGPENVVAHYANVDYGTDENSREKDKRYLASENWDAPIILTTTVQFFESLYAGRPSRCRKLHNIARSVVVFDESQLLPVPYLKPCISAISQLIGHYGSSAVLCTATQPALNRLFKETAPGFEACELCPDVEEMYEFFRRVGYEKAGMLSDTQLAERLSEENQVLCIVNNRRQAQDIFNMMDKDGAYHLSTTMCPAHRRRILAEIRDRLKMGQSCRVVSTSLVEAGVDVDFPTVYRALAGLDSMLQAGGRCNREGKRGREESVVHLFESKRKSPEIIRQNVAAAERVMRDFDDISEPEAIKEYFEFLYYTLKDDGALDAKKILGEIESGSLPFASVAERFRIIENSEFTIYIPLSEGGELVETLKKFGPSKGLMRKLGQYAVGVYPRHFTELIASGAADILTENTAVLRDPACYSENTGLAFGADEGREIII
jgi:CRISPR-associated endonuclease/helicase Cas3